MSYQALPYTYGARTSAEIDAIPTSPKIPEGSTVFNTDTQMMETYNGRLWMDERSICFKVDGGVTVVKGNLLKTSSTGEVQLATNGDNEEFCGVALRDPVGGFVAVAHAGKVQAIAGGPIVHGRFVVIDGTAGRFDDTTTGSSGALGASLESGSTGDLLWITLQTIELA